MLHTKFVTLAAEFETLQRDLVRTNDPCLRKALLPELSSKLREIEELTRPVRNELTEHLD